ncbi:hypothetical protein OROGR_002715 [Orobanche gracilis]
MRRRPTRVGEDDDGGSGGDDDDATITMGSESRQVSMWVRRDQFLDTKTPERRNTASLLEEHTAQRFKEYSIIPEDAIPNLVEEVVGLVGQTVADPRYRSLALIPVVAAVDVCTVQQEDEPLDAAMERAIRAGRLGPSECCADGDEICEELWCFLKNELPRTGVEGVDMCSNLMDDDCSICLHGHTIGTHISRLPLCGHAFHYHCAVSWLVRKNTCPLCCRQVHDLIPPARIPVRILVLALSWTLASEQTRALRPAEARVPIQIHLCCQQMKPDLSMFFDSEVLS